MKSSRRLIVIPIAVLAAAVVSLRADLPPYLQNLATPSPLEAVFYKLVPLGPASVPARRPPAETRPELGKRIAAEQNEPNLYALRAMEAERQLDLAAAESDWQRYTQLSSDQVALADFYHRRLEPAKELAALQAAATRPAFERAIGLIDEQLLGYPAAQATFRLWIQRFQNEPNGYQRWFEYAVSHNQLADAEQALKQYTAAFPQDAVFPVRAAAQIEAKRGSAQSTLGVYNRSFRPLWPPDLIKSYFELLTQTGSLRRYLQSARQSVATNPDDLAAAARIFYYWQQQGNLEAAQRPLFEFEARKEARKAPWTSDQLYTIGQLYQAANNADRAARAYHAMYTLPGADAERALASLASLLLTSAGQYIRYGSANLSYYRDIGQVDPYPGFLNGVLSLLLNTTEPRWRYEAQDQAAQAYFHRARAAELIALFDSRFPNSTERPGLHALLIQAYSIHGDNQGVIEAGRRYLAAFPDSEFQTDVAVAMADAYARTNQPQAEFALYDDTLARLAKSAGSLPTQRAGYPRILDRYLARLVSLKRVPAAVELYRREIDRNPNDPALYERFAAFLEQNRIGAEVEATYRRAMAQFPDRSWSHRLARWFLKQKQTAKLTQLTAEVAKTFTGTELETYFREAVQSGSVAATLYRQLNLYAHQRFPHSLTFVRNLLSAYTTRGTADPVAYEALLRANWMYADDLRTRFFELLSRTRRLDAELAALPKVNGPEQVNANPAAAMMLAEGDAWRTRYEAAAPVFRAIATSYPASSPVANRAAAVYRSLATIDPRQTETAAAIQQNLAAYAPRSTQALATAGEIWADRERFDRARPLWNRIAAVAPGNPENYLESATVFWDYYLYDDALRVIGEGRKRLNAPALHAYQAGAIYENKRQYDRALDEYANAVVANANEAAQRRIVRLARRPALRDQVEQLTARLANRDGVRINELQLRAAVLENQGHRPELQQFLIAAANRTDDPAVVEWVRTQGRTGGFEQVQQRAMERRVEITSDPVDRIRYQLDLAHFHEEQGRAAQAESILASTLKANPNSLGVVRAATDFYWRSRQAAKAVATLADAASRAQPEYARAFRLEASRKATESGDVSRARQILAELLKTEPLRPEYLAAMADTYARANDDGGLRAFYETTIKTLNASNLSAAEKAGRTAAMRRGLIPVLTRTGETQAALDQYIEIVNRYPEDAELTREAAAFAAKHGLGDRLVAYYTKTTAESPRDARYHMVLARVNTELERFPEAVQSYARAVAIRPERSDLWMAQGQLQERLSQFAAAEQTYSRLFELSYRNPQWMEKVAELRARQGQTDTVVAALRAAHIDNRPERADNYFAVARQLTEWGMLDAARPFADKGAEIAGNELANDSNSSYAYARIMARARQYEAAYKRLTASEPDPERAYLLHSALRAMGDVVREYYTPEEKTAFAAFLDKIRRPDSRVELEMAQAAGLHDVTVGMLATLLRTAPTDYGLLGQLQDLQQRRARFAELGSQFEELWKVTPPDTENRDALLHRAANVYAQAGATNALLRVIRLKKPTGLDYELSRHWCRLIGSQPQALSLVTAADPPELRDQAANCAIQWNRPKDSLAAVGLRGQGMPPVWTSSYTALTGLYFSLNTPEVQGAWNAALGSPVIGDQLGKPVDRDRQLAGEPWFYYASRYGEYLALMKQSNAEDYLPAMLEATPGNAGVYFRLGEYYRETGDARRAAANYANALQLNPSRADARDRTAQTLWAAGDRDRATAEWREALQALMRQQEAGGIGSDWWQTVREVLTHIGERDLLPVFQADADRLLRTYVRRNGTYEFDPLLAGILAAARDPAAGVQWLLELSRAAADPGAVLEYALRSEILTPAQKDALYPKVIEVEEAKAATSFGAPREAAESALRNWQLEWARSLVDRGQFDRARTVLAAIPEAARAERIEQIVPLELLAAPRPNGVAALLARYSAQSSPAPAELLRNAASELRRRGQAAAARSVLDFVYTRELEAHRFEAPNFLGLAGVRLEEGNTSAAVALLRRMAMLAPGEPFDTLTAGAELLARHGKTAEAADLYEARVQAVPWDAAARVHLAQLRNDTAALTAVANNRNAAYSVRADAAAAVRKRGGAALTTGAPELDLLASDTPLTEALVNQPYWYRARVEAAGGLNDAAAKIRVLLAALAVDHLHYEPRVELFNAAMSVNRYHTATTAMWSVFTQGYMAFEGTPLTDAERAALMRRMGDAFRGLDEPQQASYYYTMARSLNPPADLDQNIAAMKNILDTRAANERRRPVVSAALEQPNTVRPRLATGGAR